ncbi:MAG TPA: TadE/TadG family type IV pilus assembly protein [Rhizomicrobium sp.]|nr:TadE/TadG family type IV pilus assembly protein [Rhizomicrobium sp.]
MLKRLEPFARCKRGMAAVEFALVAPVMIAMFFGTVELSEALACRSRVDRMSATAADLVAQSTSVSTADMTNIFGASNAVLYPFSSAQAQIVVSSLVDDGHGGAKVAWSNAQHATPRTVGSAVTVPTGLIVSGSGGSVIFAEISYNYTSPTTDVLPGTITMTSSFYSRPRRSTTVTHT